MIDVVIIGNGPAGISAALYTKTAKLDTLVIGKDNGALSRSGKVNNYYGFPGGIDGNNLIELGKKQLDGLNIKHLKEEVIAIDYEDYYFTVVTNKNEYQALSVIIATGAARIKSKVDGIEQFEGKGVSYCAVCDGFLFRNKDVAVLGSGEYALHEINHLLPIVNSVSVLTNGREKIDVRDERIKVLDKSIKRLNGKDRLESVEFDDDTTLDISAVFVAEGMATSVDFARRLGVIVNDKNIVVDENYMTNIPGLFAAGDCTGGLLQISKAVSDGAHAGINVVKYIRKINNNIYNGKEE